MYNTVFSTWHAAIKRVNTCLSSEIVHNTKSKPCGVSVLDCVCVVLRVCSTNQYDFSCCYREDSYWVAAWVDIFDTITKT